MVDFAKRMEEMIGTLDDAASEADSSDTVAYAAALLEELVEIVESIDFARDLRSIGGLPVLKKLLACSSSELRWRAADVVAACAQNHVSVQVRATVRVCSFKRFCCAAGLNCPPL